MGGGFHDRGSAFGGVARLENAGSHKHAVHAQLHHQRGIRRGGNTAGSKIYYRHAPGLAHFHTKLIGRANILGKRHHLFFGQRLQRADVAQNLAGMPHSFHYVAGTCFAFGADHGRAFAHAS